MDYSKFKKFFIILFLSICIFNIVSNFAKVFATSEITLSDDNMDGSVTIPDNFVDNYYVIAFGIVNGVGYRAVAVSPNPIVITINSTLYGTFAYFANGQYGYANAGSSNGITPSTMPSYLQAEIDNVSTNYNPTDTMNSVNIPKIDNLVLYSNAVVKDQNGNTISTQTPTPSITYPELLNNSLTLENLSLQSYNISAGDFEEDTFYALFYDRSILTQDNFWDYPNVAIELSPNNQYWLDGDTNQKYDIPITDVPLTYKAGTTYSVAFARKIFDSTGGGFRGDDFTWEFLGSPRTWTTLSSVSVDLDELNTQTDKQNLINYQNNVTNNLTNIYGSLTDTNGDSSLIDLPELSVTDITANVFTSIYNTLYNAFNVTDDVVIHFTFRGTNYTISSSEFNMMTADEYTPLKLFLSAFWWFFIGRYMIYRIRKIIMNFKSANLENVASEDISADLL